MHGADDRGAAARIVRSNPAAGIQASRIQTRNHVAVHVDDLRVEVDLQAAEGTEVVRHVLVGIERAGDLHETGLAAELRVFARSRIAVPHLQLSLQVHRRHADGSRQLFDGLAVVQRAARDVGLRGFLVPGGIAALHNGRIGDGARAEDHVGRAVMLHGLLIDRAIVIGIGRVFADEAHALLVHDERRHVRNAVVRRSAGTAAEIDAAAEAGHVRAHLHAHADAVAGIGRHGEHEVVAQVMIVLRGILLGHLLVLVDGSGAEDDALGRLHADGLAIAHCLSADDPAIFRADELGDFGVVLDHSALILRILEHGLHEDAAAAGSAAALVHMDAVRIQVFAHIRDVAVTVQARPLDAAGVGEPVDVLRRALGQVGNELFVHVVLAGLDPQRSMLLRGVVLILGEFLLEAGAGSLHNAAGEVGGAAGNTSLFIDQHLRAGSSGLGSSGYARAARADDQHVGLNVPGLLGHGGRHDAHRRNAQRADGSALQKVSAGYVLHSHFSFQMCTVAMLAFADSMIRE